jgi:flavin-dependent dehydrogenase
MQKRVDIFGAGLAGCVAAIHLGRAGLEVHLHDQERRPGGNPTWHPSVQTTVLDAQSTWKFLDLDLSTHFQPVANVSFYRYGRKDHLQLSDFYVVERGPRASSLDVHLFNFAQKEGAIFHSSQTFQNHALSASGKVILACGLDQRAYADLELPSEPIFGYRAVMKSDRDRELLSFMLPCTNYDFAYLAAANGLLFGLLFSRRSLPESNLTQFIQVLSETENIRMPRWMYSTGAIATRPNLFWKGRLLAGSLAGCIDPFLLHGISGAMVSGYLAALAVLDPPAAVDLFERVTRNHARKRLLKKIAVKTPLKNITMPFIMWLESKLAGVGFLYQKEEQRYARHSRL